MRSVLGILLAGRGGVEWLAASVSGDAPGRADALALLRLSLGL